MERITAIRKSLAAFVCGIFGLVPVLGLVPAVWTFLSWNAVRLGYANEWNPACRYLHWGIIMALLGLLNSLLISIVVIFTLLFR